MASITKFWLQVSALVAFLFFVITALVPFINRVQITIPSRVGSFRATKHNVWADLSKEEANGLTKFLLSQSELNLTEVSDTTGNDNTIGILELLQPNKTEVLAYLNGSSKAPDRWARVVIDERVTEAAQYTVYAVGPLPITESSKILPLDYCYNSGRNHVSNFKANQVTTTKWLLDIALAASDITLELLGREVSPYDPHSFPDAIARMSLHQNGSLSGWAEVLGHSINPGSGFLLPQGLYIEIFIEGSDPNNWKALQWYYNGMLYESADHLREAMKSPGFKKNGLNLDGKWTALEDFSEGLPDRKNPPPIMVHPSGARYKVDQKEKFVSWMGFDFFLSTSSDTGVALHDLKFNGDSVIFELGLQETYVTYASDDPKQGGQDFLDSGFLMGMRMSELVPGYDCPAYATFLSTEFHAQGETVHRKNVICIFEYTADHPLQRHTSEGRVSIGRNTYMVVRYVSTVGNYDYSFDYIFYLDGTIEVKVRASGYIFGVFWNENASPQDEYGYRIQKAAATSMHDHVLNFKADLDVAGTSNTMVRVGIEATTKNFSWDNEETSPRNTMHLVPRTVEKETGINWAPNAGEILVVMNENVANAWGEKRGYRIQPGSGIGAPSHRIAPNSTSSGVAAEWATQDLWVLKRKDTEPKSSTIFQALAPEDPLVDFRKFVDDEEIVDDDLVIFFNLGNHHVPHSGDIPNTLMHTSASSVMFTPFNFNDHDPTRQSAQGVSIDNNKGKTRTRYYGGRYHEGASLKATDLEPDQSGYDGPLGSAALGNRAYSVSGFMELAIGLF